MCPHAAACQDDLLRPDADGADPEQARGGHDNSGLQPAADHGCQPGLDMAFDCHRDRLHVRRLVPCSTDFAHVPHIWTAGPALPAGHARSPAPGRGCQEPHFPPLRRDAEWRVHNSCHAAAAQRLRDQRPETRDPNGGLLPEQHGRSLAESAAAVQRHHHRRHRFVSGDLLRQHWQAKCCNCWACDHLRHEAHGHSESGEPRVGGQGDADGLR
mmetsp:Transcript_49596/g.141788  ORF Transcript_49596/g.141788 Transcript_49596/m.141788 type:complete len:213 (-) Transcript_49596:833-1471(-)